MAVTADTIRLISQGEYIIGTSGTISEADFSTFLLWATSQFSLDNPGNSTDAISDLAIGLLICHYIDRTKNDQHITAEKAGDGSTEFDSSGSNWMKSYQEIISSLKVKAAELRANPGLTVKQPSSGVTRKDAGSSGIGMAPSTLSG
jgi:hypothetical protein